MRRRGFLTTLAAAGAAATAARALASTRDTDDGSDQLAVLIDLTVCEGCRACEYACAEANGLPAPADVELEGLVERKTSPDQFVALSSYPVEGQDVYVRRQCMQCVEPACAAACLTKALEKTEDGPIVWHADKCMGCRFCMISCPFDIPQFEYHSANPRIRKCELCVERLEQGEQPACVEECPAEALNFGKRSEMLELARQRIYQEPDRYVSHIYGEHEAGGTNLLYLSGVPFEQLGFRMDLGTTAFPEFTRQFLTSVPVIYFLWPAMMLGIWRSRQKPSDVPVAEAVNGGGRS